MLEGSRSTRRLPLLPGPLPMEAIEKMASLCMRDPDEDEEELTDEDVEADDDLLVSAQSGAGGFLPLLPHPLGTHSSPWPVSLQAELNEVLGEEQNTSESRLPVAQVDL